MQDFTEHSRPKREYTHSRAVVCLLPDKSHAVFWLLLSRHAVPGRRHTALGQKKHSPKRKRGMQAVSSPGHFIRL